MIINSKTTARDLMLNSGTRKINYKLQKLESYQPGVLVSILHFLLSRIRAKADFSVMIDMVEVKEKDLIFQFFEFYQLLVLLLFDDEDKVGFEQKDLAKKLKSIYMKKVKIQEYLYTTEIKNKIVYEDFRQKELDSMRNALFAVKSAKKLLKGFSFLIPCFDHLHTEFLHESNYFYNQSQIKHSEDIELWVNRLFSYHKLKLDPSGTHNTTLHIAEIIKELFHNTNDWAKTSYNNQYRYTPNFRGCYISLYLENRLNMDLLGSIDHVDDYLKSVLKSNQNDLQISNAQQSEIFNNSKIAICEISIVDTGPGMARRWSEKDYSDLSYEEELELVVECFHKYITSDESGRMSLRGQGLCKVLSIIRKIGFVRVHSGNVLLMRNFLSAPLSEGEINEGIVDFDAQKVGQVEGTSITILYPILYSQ